MNDYLEFFDEYVFKGLMPIAVIPGTKQPAEKGWNKNWSRDHWRKFFLREEKYEIGLLWNNGMIDVESDNQKSNEFLNKLIGDVRRPIYKSHRSYHNIFLSPYKNITKANLYGKKGEKIEVFGKRSFTMAPPSIHAEGTRYTFVDNFWPPPPCPNAIKALYFNQKNISLKNKDKTLTQCQDCGVSFCVHKSRLKLEVRIFLEKNLGWKCVGCRKRYGIDVKKRRRELRILLNE